MADVLLINPAYYNIIYRTTKVEPGVPINPLLNLALLAAPAVEKGYKVKILDLNIINNFDLFLKDEIRKENPRIAGITFTSPLYSEAKRLAGLIKELNPDTLIVAGGAHATVFPEDIIKESLFDIVAIGEADFVIKDLLELPFKEIRGIAFRQNGAVIKTPERNRIEDLDSLPYPAWGLYSLDKYNRFSLSNKVSPPGYLETSRGCPGDCVFCYKRIQGKKFRSKSIKRVIDEIKYMLGVGFKEINILDDNFSTDLNRAKLICEEIIRKGLKFPWHPQNGVRVDSVDRELLFMMKKSGCYRVSFGIESGNQGVLEKIDKNIKLHQIEQAVNWAKLEGLETFGFFMLGLPGDTEKSMQETINFARRLKLDFAQFTIATPFPGTKIFQEWDDKGYIKTYDWTKYNFNMPSDQVYSHPTLSQNILNKYFKKAYFSFYFNPVFLLSRFVGGVKRKTVLRDARLFFKINWFN